MTAASCAPAAQKTVRSKHVRQIFNIHDNTLARWRNKNKIVFFQVGQFYFYPVDQPLLRPFFARQSDGEAA